MNNILDKFSKGVIKNLDRENAKQIINCLRENNCDYIQDIIEDYLDLFTMDVTTFKEKFDIVNKKYNNEFINYAKTDMNLFEELYL